ncbi:hypothetical protein TRFO_32137 [Tritrichomonas foetus]|uniref:Uncharacterized protein n=1 Tax=Tritrichomonas foetus TaxID=1144522 RepID=A0A1J4JP96_9EUKA|nr:hypothetical protein TRFO_32137 [Tritrichomonas foetus]|eukprot:OHT00975.1 hypothetical protein TRFO_32137 [Tritrichomonas foetus]
MEPEASRAAIAAIAALQKRVKELEDENTLLEQEHESLMNTLNSRDTAYTIRENALNEATAKAKLMLSGASAALIQIREARTENRRLKQQIDETEQLIDKQKTKCRTYTRSSKKISLSLSQLLEKLAEYESLLSDLLTPPPQTTTLTPEEIILISSSENDPDLLPPPLSDILRTMQNLPKDFCRQNIETKRSIVQALIAAKAATSDIKAKISHLEKQKFSSSTPVKFESSIHKLATHLLILSNEMKRFRFV